MKQCDICHKKKPESAYYQVPKRHKGVKATYCWACACEKMVKWSKQQNVGKLPPPS